jgi:puromycin-sensitive aminopeptidase
MVVSEVPGTDPSAEHRLPYEVQPSHYEIRLAPDLESSSFSGVVRITATAVKKVSEIVLNSAELEVTSAAVTDGSGSTMRAETNLDDEKERLTLLLPEPVEEGLLIIDIEFCGVLNDQLHGFYRSTFVDPEGVKQSLATTQFEATDARRAFPCFDEPDRKAVFSMSVDVPPGLCAYSNGPVVEETPMGDGLTRTRFGETIPMSSYLVACVVGPLVATEPRYVRGVPVRVVHVPGKEHLCEFALDAAEHALEFFTDWFGIPYPGQKLDLLAIPDFAFGAMENLGCVTFREVVLLIDPSQASRTELERVADVVSHEIAHMWFGDLVTMKWWNGIWLNEAFATFMEVMCVDHFRPEWERWVSFGMERAAAMATDALHSTRPVEYPVGPPEEAQGMFDVLTYQKGGSVLRMLEQYLGPEVFRDGVRQYLREHELSNTETSDLWDAIEAASGEPVREIMDSWILQGGFPLVSVRPRASAGADASTLALEQRPFWYADNPGPNPSAIGSNWQIPVISRRVGSSEDPDVKILLGSQGALVELAEMPTPAPDRADAPLVFVNARGNGFYRVSYPPTYIERLASSLGSLDPLERSILLGDTWASVVAGNSDLDEFMVLAESMGQEDDADVWVHVTSALLFLDHAVDDTTRPRLAQYARGLVRPAFDRLGWTPRAEERARTPGLRAQLLASLGTVGRDEAVRALCETKQSADLSGAEPVDPDLASAVAVVVASSGRADFDSFLERYRHPRTPQDEMRYRHALSVFPDPVLAERVFELAMTEVRTQDVAFLVMSMLSHRDNGPATWRRVRENWDALLDRIPAQSASRMLEGVTQLCRDRRLADDIRAFLAQHPVKMGRRSVEQTVERLGVNLAFTSRLSATVDDSLAAGIERLSRS